MARSLHSLKTSQKIMSLLNLDLPKNQWISERMQDELTMLKAGMPFNAPELLFSKITPEQVEQLAVKYKEKKENA